MVNNVKKLWCHIVYIRYFAKYEKTKVKLDIKKYGYKLILLSTNEFEFDVQKYETPKAKLIALSDKSIKLIDVYYGWIQK
ncbi:hypothetical protein HYD93_02415 [Mycoplasmopsis bovis]|nr:hypothetical protein [Mycoplasmopsis bovis]QQH35203.1 hypothetical protein HYD93_02415 [Mycoplasmopsis bovis]